MYIIRSHRYPTGKTDCPRSCDEDRSKKQMNRLWDLRSSLIGSFQHRKLQAQNHFAEYGFQNSTSRRIFYEGSYAHFPAMVWLFRRNQIRWIRRCPARERNIRTFHRFSSTELDCYATVMLIAVSNFLFGCLISWVSRSE